MSSTGLDRKDPIVGRSIVERAFLALWLIGNIWLVKPYHPDAMYDRSLSWALFIGNVFVFAYLGWRGKRTRSIAFRWAWPLAAIACWIVAPPVWAGLHWGNEAAVRILLAAPPWFFWAYVVICLGVRLFVGVCVRGKELDI